MAMKLTIKSLYGRKRYCYTLSYASSVFYAFASFELFCLSWYFWTFLSRQLERSRRYFRLTINLIQLNSSFSPIATQTIIARLTQISNWALLIIGRIRVVTFVGLGGKIEAENGRHVLFKWYFSPLNSWNWRDRFENYLQF